MHYNGAVISVGLKKSVDYFHNLDDRPRVYLYPLAIVAGLLFTAISGISGVFNIAELSLTGLVLWMLWFGLLFVMACPPLDRKLYGYFDRLKSTALATFIALVLIVVLEFGFAGLVKLNVFGREVERSRLIFEFGQSFSYTDATALSHQAAENLLDGLNPYAHPNVMVAMRDYNGATDRITPLRKGEFADDFPAIPREELQRFWYQASLTPEVVPPEIETKVNYPAGSFIIPAPFLFLGIPDLRIVYAIFIIAAIALIARKISRLCAVAFLGATAVSYDIWNSITSSDTASLYFPFLLVGWVMLPSNLWLSACCMGLAISVKQIAWFFIPFYAILVFSREGAKRGTGVMAVMGCIFLGLNLPFILQDPVLWLTSVFAPLLDPMFPLGGGLVSLVTSGVINNIHSPLLFTILELLAFLTGIIWYWRNHARYPNTGPVLAIVPLFFAWRSMWPYFFFTGIIVFASVLMERRTASVEWPEDIPGYSNAVRSSISSSTASAFPRPARDLSGPDK